MEELRAVELTDWSAARSPLAVLTMEHHCERAPHRHDFSELALVTRGRGLHCTEGVEHPIGRGDVIVITGARSHAYREPCDLGLVNVLYDPRRLPLNDPSLQELPGYHALFTIQAHGHYRSRFRLPPQAFAEAERLVELIALELREGRPGGIFLAKAHFLHLVGFLARRYAHADDSLRFGGILSLMQAQLAEPLSLPQLAARAGQPVPSFVRAFRRVTGASPIAYLLTLRLERAAGLLRSEQSSITQVALDCGFNDSTYFARQFRRRYGCTPRDYRQRK